MKWYKNIIVFDIKYMDNIYGFNRWKDDCVDVWLAEDPLEYTVERTIQKQVEEEITGRHGIPGQPVLVCICFCRKLVKFGRAGKAFLVILQGFAIEFHISDDWRNCRSWLRWWWWWRWRWLWWWWWWWSLDSNIIHYCCCSFFAIFFSSFPNVFSYFKQFINKNNI